MLNSDFASTDQRIQALLDHLGIARCHVAGCMSGDWSGLVERASNRICSLTILAPHLNKGTPAAAGDFGAPTLVIAGDQGTPGERARNLAARFADARLVALTDYESPMWADTVADRTGDVADALFAFLAAADRQSPAVPVDLSPNDGEHAGLLYRVRGAGPALLLLPLSLAPSQWQPIEAKLAERYCTVTLGGAHLGAVSLIEARADSGYGDLIAALLAQVPLAPGATVLEVGCGSGPLARRLARRTDGRNAIVAADLNAYLLSEARRLTEADGLADAIRYVEANGEALGFSEDSFDLVYCCTVLEEGDADRMIGELVRVVRPGGRIVALTRCTDVDWWTGLDLPAELKRRIDAFGPATGSGLGPGGCADASLYARLSAHGLQLESFGPQFAIYREGARLDDVLDRLVAPLDTTEAKLCRDAIAQAHALGTLFVAEPFHCAVATKPATG